MALIESDEEGEENVTTSKFTDFQKRFKIKQSKPESRNLKTDRGGFKNISVDYTLENELKSSINLDKTMIKIPQKVCIAYF